MDFNIWFKQWLHDNDIKQIDIAKKLNVDRNYISNIVNGRTPPSEKLLNS